MIAFALQLRAQPARGVKEFQRGAVARQNQATAVRQSGRQHGFEVAHGKRPQSNHGLRAAQHALALLKSEHIVIKHTGFGAITRGTGINRGLHIGQGMQTGAIQISYPQRHMGLHGLQCALHIPAAHFTQFIGRQADKLQKHQVTKWRVYGRQLRVFDKAHFGQQGAGACGNRTVGGHPVAGRKNIAGAKYISRNILQKVQRPAWRLLLVCAAGQTKRELEPVAAGFFRFNVKAVVQITVEIAEAIGHVMPVRLACIAAKDADAVERIFPTQAKLDQGAIVRRLLIAIDFLQCLIHGIPALRVLLGDCGIWCAGGMNVAGTHGLPPLLPVSSRCAMLYVNLQSEM